MDQQIDLTQLPVARQLDWRIEFGLWLRQSPTQKRRERSPLSVSAYEGDVNQLAAWFEAQYLLPFQPDQLNQVNLSEYFQSLQCAPATFNRKLASVRMLIQWAALDPDPTQWIARQDATRTSPRDVDEDERLMLELAAEDDPSVIGLRDGLIFFLMSNAGLRISEVINLQLSDLHLDEGYIHVFGKGGKHRRVTVGGRLAMKLNEWLGVMPASIEGTVITDENGFSIRRETAWRRFCIIAERAGVNVTPHAMRHTFVIRFMDAIMAGDASKLPAAIDAVCQQTGDRPDVILTYYTRARQTEIRAAAEVM